jgi:hypothetical protein
VAGSQLVSRIFEAAYWRFHPRVRRWAEELPRQRRIDEAFDRRFGVDTAGELPLTQLGMSGAEARRGHGVYRPTWTHVFREALDKLPIDLDRFTFVDYGSGKGKALLLASDYPFEEIVGVEFARPLHEIAARNIERYSSPAQRCRALRSECADALHFEPPLRPLVCFLFNPFDEATTGAVLDRVGESVRQRPRDVFLVYANMRNVREGAHLFRGRRDLVRVAEDPRYLIYRYRDGGAPAA